MSESCPNCGSKVRTTALWNTWIKMSTRRAWPEPDKYQCVLPTDACELIRSLREELAEARATLKNHELVCYGAMERDRDAERDRIADWIENYAASWIAQPDDHDWYRLNAARRTVLRHAVKIIRNNEHRSDT